METFRKGVRVISLRSRVASRPGCVPLWLTVAVLLFGTVLSAVVTRDGAADERAADAPAYSLATFSADVTPPAGSPLCGGLVKPVAGVTEPLQALGVVVFGAGDPIVLCAVDWCEIRNRDHVVWREQLAKAAGTTPDRVAVQSLHQHNAPIADTLSDHLLRDVPSPLDVHDSEWMLEVLAGVAKAVHEAADGRQPLTHIALGETTVAEVASNRRVMGPDGKVQAVRTSATKDANVRAAPEGTIDSRLKTISFWNGEQKLAVLHYYAIHPMSYYGDGIVSSDFVGIARERRTAEDRVPHIYFTGCGGNVTAGKYNDGNPENRPILANRMFEAMKAAETSARKTPVGRIAWQTKPVVLPLSDMVRQEELLNVVRDPQAPASKRITTAFRLTYHQYASAETPIVFSCLHLGDAVRVVHLPGEPFIEYQLFAQETGKGKFVAVAGYGDGGCGYIPLEKSFAEGGYEPTQSYAAPASETVVRKTIAELLKP